MSVQTIKSSQQPRVNTGVSNNMAVARLNGQFTALCGASWPDLQNDIFGRNVGHLGVDMRGAAACNDYMPPGQSVMNHITRENLNSSFALSLTRNRKYKIESKDKKIARDNPFSRFAEGLIQNPNYELELEDKKAARKNPASNFAYGLSLKLLQCRI